MVSMVRDVPLERRNVTVAMRYVQISTKFYFTTYFTIDPQ